MSRVFLNYLVPKDADTLEVVESFILTNKSVMIIKNVVLDRSVSKEEIADMKKLAERLEGNE